jgi:hypothetical protein
MQRRMEINAGMQFPERVDPPVMGGLDSLIVYEDVGSGLRAKQALDLMQARFGEEVRGNLRLWKLDLLCDPTMCEQSAREGAMADVIILCVDGRTEVPSVMRDWLGHWCRHKQERPYAFGVLLDPEPAAQCHENPIVVYLKEWVATVGADFFCGTCNGPASGLEVRAEGTSGRPKPCSALEAEPSHRDGPYGWGGLKERKAVRATRATPAFDTASCSGSEDDRLRDLGASYPQALAAVLASGFYERRRKTGPEYETR